MEMIADTGRLASLDVMELNPALDVGKKTAQLAVDLIESLFGKSTLMRARAGCPRRCSSGRRAPARHPVRLDTCAGQRMSLACCAGRKRRGADRAAVSTE